MDKNMVCASIVPCNAGRMSSAQHYIIVKVFKSLQHKIKMNYLLFAFAFLFFISLASAWPYQLNLSNGALTDLNESNNETANFTIYVIMQNYTYMNFTNITYENLTCVNCSYTYNETNEYFLYNGSLDFYNKTEQDAKFLTIVDFNNYKTALTYPYVTTADFNSAIDNLNQTISNKKEDSHGYLWAIAIISILLSAAAIAMALRNQ